MQAVKSKDTAPEMIVRRRLHRLGYRYRLHQKDLPGSPDIVFASRRKTIFVHGCFWHGHDCSKGRLPKSRQDYWRPKLERNFARDKANVDRLNSLGWQVLTVWQCELVDLDKLTERIDRFLSGSNEAKAEARCTSIQRCLD